MTRDEVLAIIKQAEEEGWEELDLSGQGLTELPEEIGRLSQLKVLKLGINRETRRRNLLAILPKTLAQLTNLQSLYLSHNKLGSLPEGLAQLTNLQHLDLSFNKLGNLPAWLAQLPQLRTLSIYRNPITEPSAEILGDALRIGNTADIEALRRYFQQLQEAGEETFYEAKLLIIGEGGAGKTSLARKLKEPDMPLNSDEASTEGIEVSVWDFILPDGYEQKQYRVNIWDFGGQEVYHSTHQFFLTKRSVYVLVADARREDTDFYTWLRMQETFGGGSPVILLKNQNRKTVGRFNLQTFADLQSAFPNLQEAIDLDLDNVPTDQEWPRLLEKLEGRFLSLEHVGQPRPKTWVRVREALNERPEDTISLDQYLTLCKAQGVKENSHALQLSEYLHNLGDILHFQHDRLLENTVILKPTWGLDAVYRVLDNQAIVDNKGRFNYNDLRQLWHEAKYRPFHNQLLRLMEKFQLCYRLDGRLDTFIAPQLLENKRPSYPWDKTNNLQLRYKYTHFMPRGIVSRAIVKLHNRIEDQSLVWQSGVILSDGFARAEMIAKPELREIHIRISGGNKRDLLMEIVRALEELHHSFPKLDYQKLIPCNCDTCQDSPSPHFFELDVLRRFLSKGRQNHICNLSADEVNIRTLLSDGYEGLERPEMVNNYYIEGDMVLKDKVLRDKVLKDKHETTIRDLKESAVSLGDGSSASVSN